MPWNLHDTTEFPPRCSSPWPWPPSTPTSGPSCTPATEISRSAVRAESEQDQIRLDSGVTRRFIYLPWCSMLPSSDQGKNCSMNHCDDQVEGTRAYLCPVTHGLLKKMITVNARLSESSNSYYLCCIHATSTSPNRAYFHPRPYWVRALPRCFSAWVQSQMLD